MIAIIRNLDEGKLAPESIGWATRQLLEQLALRQIPAEDRSGSASSEPADLCIRLGNSQEEGIAGEPEAFRITRSAEDGRDVLDIAASGTRGFVYALLELADRVKLADDPLQDLLQIGDVRERPKTQVRSINRLFASEAEDKPWFYDRSFWQAYFTELATQRFNKFHLALGMGYDYGHDPGVRDNYFCFAYPFLVDVPGYDVTVKGLPEGEAARNLSMLRWISEEAKLRGIHFQLGLWTHAYDPSDSPEADYIIEGVNPDNHAAYCRAAVRTVLQECPAIDGITFRIHYESGIPEPAHAFWKEVFTGVAEAGRPLQLDLHPKGADDQLIQAALDTGLEVLVSPKFWAEHMGLPYHQAAIREKEMPTDHTDRPELMALTATSRRFTRYGYADYLKEGRKYGVIYRIWPGTQRVLLWGDPVMASAYARSGSFSGGLGLELCEPLTFKGRKGSGTEGGREPYAEPSLRLDGQEWRKYLYYYRVWGRMLYNPEGDAEPLLRYLRSEFGEAAEACGNALASASRILPLITTAHLPSAANNVYWPEMYANMAIMRTEASFYDFDTLPPHTFNSVSPLDPALFYSIDEFAADRANGKVGGKVTPLATAWKLAQWADAALRDLAEAAAKAKDPQAPAFRRWAVDIEMLAGLGRFFASKLTAGCQYACYRHDGDAGQLADAIANYRQAKATWENLSRVAEVYAKDITFGYVPYMRGHWSDRLPAIEADLAAMERAGEAAGHPAPGAKLPPAPRPEVPAWRHVPPKAYRRGEPIELELDWSGEAQGSAVTLYVRHANQAESCEVVAMARDGGRYSAVIPATYTDTVYPLVYYFEAKNEAGEAWLLPGFDANYANQPYYLLRQSV